MPDHIADYLTLSVIVPVYNVEGYLRRCLDSILPLLEFPAELILVDDGSTDGSGKICDEYAGKYENIRAVHQENRGVSSARNLGVSMAKGEYVAFFDSDDYIYPEVFLKVWLALSAYPGRRPQVLASDFIQINTKDHWRRETRQIRSGGISCSDLDFSEFVRPYGAVWNVWRYLFQRDFLLRHSLRFQESSFFGEDLEYMVRVFAAAEKMGFLHAPYYCYENGRTDSAVNTVSRARIRNLLGNLEAAADFILHTPGYPCQKRMLEKLFIEYLYNFSMLRLLHGEERREALRIFQEYSGLLARFPGKWPACFQICRSICGGGGTVRLMAFLRRVKRAGDWFRRRGKGELYG